MIGWAALIGQSDPVLLKCSVLRTSCQRFTLGVVPGTSKVSVIITPCYGTREQQRIYSFFSVLVASTVTWW